MLDIAQVRGIDIHGSGQSVYLSNGGNRFDLIFHCALIFLSFVSNPIHAPMNFTAMTNLGRIISSQLRTQKTQTEKKK